MKIIDGTELKLGRLASNAAKEALKGEQISIVNAEKIVITGRKKDILAQYHEIRSVGSKYKGPFFPRQPHLIVRRTIRGMLAYKKETGRNAFKNIKVYVGIPKELQGKKTEIYEDSKLGFAMKKNYMTVDDLSRYLGVNK